MKRRISLATLALVAAGHAMLAAGRHRQEPLKVGDAAPRIGVTHRFDGGEAATRQRAKFHDIVLDRPEADHEGAPAGDSSAAPVAAEAPPAAETPAPIEPANDPATEADAEEPGAPTLDPDTRLFLHWLFVLSRGAGSEEP